MKRNTLGAVMGYLRPRDIGGFRLTSDLRFVMTGYTEKPIPPDLAEVGAESVAQPIAVGGGAR